MATLNEHGFRLLRLEVYNWGTFNHRVWPVEPEGNTALLTGANGSGKSTLVDALLTLLVPNGRRNYNQASGAEKRRERDERSYVRGAYGRVKDEENNRGVVQYLRDKNDYAVLLAVFADGRTTVSLAHVFYWREDELRKFHVVAQRAMRIADDLRVTSTADELRKRLRAAGAEVYDEFNKYSRQLIKVFGLRSEKALDLFNQTVSIKEIGGLNDFVRQHMLERTDASEKITQLQETYQNLTRAHDAIAKAEAQIARLEPLLQEADQLVQTQARIAEAERCAQLVPAYIARRKLDMLARAIDTARTKTAEHSAQAAALKTHLDTLRQQEIDLNVAISSDTAGQQLQQLRREIGFVQERRREKKVSADKYNDTARKLNATSRSLNLPLYSTNEAFFANRKQITIALAPLEAIMKSLVEDRDERKQTEGRLLGVAKELRVELDSLRQRKSRIPADDLRIRNTLAEALDIEADELPFVGELLKVRDAERPWEGAIERLLRGYGRQLLVPESHYHRVSGYVDATNLRGRLVYHRVDPRRSGRATANLGDDALILKLEIKPDSSFHDWLKTDLSEHYDYVCCETIKQFERERRALTINGQIKRGGAQHEKDDRFDIRDRAQYVLGWDNREKIAALEADLQTNTAKLKQIQDAIVTLEKEQKQREEQRRLLQELLGYEDFALIDWQTEERRISDLQMQLQALEASSNRLAQLQSQLTTVKTQVATAEADLARAQKIVTTLENDITRFERGRGEASTRLAAVPAGLLQTHTPLIDQEATGRNLLLETIDTAQGDLERFFTQRAGSYRGNANATERSMITRIVEFKRDYPEDTADMDQSVEAVGEFRHLHERIARDDLPAHRKRFKEWLDNKVIDAIVGFQSALEKRVNEYRESITTLNGSLRRIAYTPATFIQLTAEITRDAEIQQFRQALRGCIPDVALRTPEANEASFQRIRALIARFEKEERWTEKVTDVRRWLEFAAEERYAEDGEIKNYYSDSSGKSGGQKAKLAYTILASAIAYQYGLAQDEIQPRTFRFVVVDEAFSKSDETNARYAMDLFRQLGLQLLVVTPLDKTHVVEPYISACHFVSNNQQENDSKVYNLTIAQYLEQKASFVRQAASARVEQ